MVGFQPIYRGAVLAWRRLRIACDVAIVCSCAAAAYVVPLLSSIRLKKMGVLLLTTIPILLRSGRSLAHFILSLLIMPGQLITYDGYFLRLLPNALASQFEVYRQARKEMGAALLQRFPNAQPIKITTADNCVIDGVHYLSKRTTANGPTLIRFNGNAEMHEFCDGAIINAYLEAGVNVVAFNYRGIGDSSWGSSWRLFLGQQLCGGMILDGDAIVQYITTVHNVPLRRILLLGHSMGGAVAAQVAALHPEVNLVNSRSFGELSKVIADFAPKMIGLSPLNNNNNNNNKLVAVADWIGKVSSFFACLAGWELNTSGVWSQCRGFKWIEYVREDHIIVHSTSLLCSLAGSDSPLLQQRGEGEYLEEGGLKILYLQSFPRKDNHNRPYSATELAAHLKLVKKALDC